jgi:eukaryotic-like serine/threonine-protein kinase
MMQVCDALVTAHGRGILHRDLKPENVMLLRSAQRGEDRVKVLDFGIAKIVAPDERLEDAPTSITGSGLTSVGAVLGTPEYMSPEQCQGGRLDFRSDIYACGVLLYQLVTGQVPFSGETPVHTMLKHVREPPVLPRSVAPGLDSALETVILRALEKRPEDRYASAAELGAALAAAIGHAGAWTPFETLAPGEISFAATPTPTGIPHLGGLGVALSRAHAAGAPPSAFAETLQEGTPPADIAEAILAASARHAAMPQGAPPQPPRPAPRPADPHPASLHTPSHGVPDAQSRAPAQVGGPTPPGAY